MYKKTILFIILMTLFSTGCSSSFSKFYYSQQDNTTRIQFGQDKIYEYKFDNIRYRNRLGHCVRDGYTIRSKFKDSDLFIENIDLEAQCSWNGLSKDLYIGFIEKETVRYRMKLLTNIESDNYEFSIYKTKNGCNLYLISIYRGIDMTFIVDKKGTFFYDLLSKTEPNIKLEKIDIKCSINFNSSLIDDNIVGNYFESSRIF